MSSLIRLLTSAVIYFLEEINPAMCRRDRNSPNVLRARGTGRRSAQHAAVATQPCFLAEVKNAATSLLIAAEGDGVGHRDGE